MISERQKQYLEEVQRLQHIVINEGQIYSLKNKSSIKIKVLQIKSDNLVSIETIHSKFVQDKTLHWCKKNLISDPTVD